MNDIKSIDARLNEMILQGQHLEAFEEFYADDIVMQEPEGIREGKDANRAFLQRFHDGIESINDLRLNACAVHGNVSFSEWSSDITYEGGPRLQLDAIAVRRYDDRSRVVHERFYYRK